MSSGARDGRSVTIGGHTYPVVGPRLGDSRLHLASVVITIHVLGQTALDFRLSIVHIAVSIGVCFLIEGVRTAVRDHRLVWPASAMLTGSGVALILRLPDTRANDPWATDGWEIYLIVAALSLISKYLIRFRGGHVFNPSNLVLVLTFLALGSSRVEPLDLWWAPFGPAMILAYVVIIVGGVAIASRLDLLSMAAAFWLTLAVGMGTLAVGGHCMTALWDLHPVCDGHFAWVVLTSPETLIFLFFMITDPRTIPESGAHRVGFAVAVAVVSTLFMAPQTTEFATKVGLLAGLTICSAARPLITVATARRTRHEQTGDAVDALVPAQHPPRQVPDALAVAAVVAFVAATWVLGTGAREIDAIDEAELATLPDPETVVPRVDPATMPSVAVDDDLRAFDPGLDDAGARELAARCLWLLQVESEAMSGLDEPLLRSVTQGPRRLESTRRLQDGVAAGIGTATAYEVRSLSLRVVREGQDAARIGVDVVGVRRETDTDRAGSIVATRATEVDTTFVISGTSRRSFLFDELPRED